MDSLLQNIGLLNTYSLYQGNELKQAINAYKQLDNIEGMNTRSNKDLEDLEKIDINFKDLLSKYTQVLHS